MPIQSEKTLKKTNILHKLLLFSCSSLGLVISIGLLLALFTFNANDPAWSHNDGNTVTNALGVVGAWYSDLSFSLIGKMSYLVPLSIIAISVRSLLNRQFDKELFAWQMTMTFTAVIVGCILLTRHSLHAINSVSQTGGGAVGAFLTIGLEKTLPVSLIMLISIVLFLAAIGIIFNISWLSFMEFIGAKILQLFGLATAKKSAKKIKTNDKPNDSLQEKIKFLNEVAEKKQKSPNSKPESESKQNHSFTISKNQNSLPETDLDKPLPQTEIKPSFERAPEPLSIKETKHTDEKVIDKIFDNNTPDHDNLLEKVDKVTDLAPSVTINQAELENKAEPSFFDFSDISSKSNAEPEIPEPIQIDTDLSAQQAARVNFSNESILRPEQPLEINNLNKSEPTDLSIDPTPELSQAFSAIDTHAPTTESLATNFNPVQEEKREPVTPTQKLDTQATNQRPVEIAKPEPTVTSTPLTNIPKSQATIGKVYQNQETDTVIEKKHELPSINFLDNPPPQTNAYTEDMLAEIADKLETTLKQFKLDATVMHVSPGPVITRFEIDLAPGVQAKKITALSRDLARALAVNTVRVEEVIPGSSYIGLEVPNLKRQIVYFKDILRSRPFRESKSPLTLSLGSDISGKPVVADLAKMPHLLVAGTTGSGKSVAINVMLLSMLYKASPKDLRLILVDPKMLEMSMYEDIPHLLTPVITDMNDAENALTWAVAEMERRYQLMAALKVRKIEAFNQVVDAGIKNNDPIKDPLWDPNESNGYRHQPNLERLPFIVIVIDELADMMMVVGKQVEQLIARLTQKARAAGIHVILATQRPSVDVLTGLIKANVPTRIAFQVSSKIDSRTIIDGMGAENLLGYGDMLYVPPGISHPQRLHGAFVDDEETDRITSFLRETGEPDYINGITAKQDPSSLGAFGASEKSEAKEDEDPLYQEAIEIVITSGKASISSVQRQLRIGYNRAARMIEQMQAEGIVSEPVNGIRRVLSTSVPSRD